MSLPINHKILNQSPYTIPTNNGLINLALNENYCQHVNDTIPKHANFYFGDVDKLNYLKELLAKHVGCDNSNILVTNGSGCGLKLLLETFVDVDTKIGILSPNYPGFIHDAQLSKGKVVMIDYPNSHNRVDNIDINILYISNPNLPLGYSFSNQELENMLKNNPNILFIIDEAYHEFLEESSFGQYVNNFPNLIVVKTLSKAFGLAGMRVGYVITNSNLMNKIEITYDSKVLLLDSVNHAITIMENRDYYLKQIRDFCELMSIFKFEIQKIMFKEIYASNFTKCPWFLLICKNPAQVCEVFAQHKFLVRDKSSEIKGAVRITFAPQFANDIIKVVKSINFGYDRVIFDLDGTMRKTYNSTIEPYITNNWKALRTKYGAQIITNNCTPRGKLIRMLANNGINDVNIICPILDGPETDWFIQHGELYITRYPAEFTHEFALELSNAKVIKIIETDITTPSAELDMLPNVPLPHIGLILKYIEIVNPDAEIKIIGKTTLMLEKNNLKILMIGDTDIDKTFAQNNDFDFFDVRIASLEQLITNML